MIRFCLFALFVSIFPASIFAQEKPRRYSLERYSVIWQNSMFTKNKAKPKDIPNASVYWTLSGTFKYDGGAGAVIVNQKNGTVEQIETMAKNASGYLLVEVLQDEKSGTTSVKVENEGKAFWVSNQPKSSRPSNGSSLATRE